MATELPEIIVTADETPKKPPVDTGPAAVVAQEGPATAVEDGEWKVSGPERPDTDEWKVSGPERPDKSTVLGQMGTGFIDPVEGGGQLISNILPKPVRETLDTFNNWAAKHSGGLIRELPPGGKNQQMQEREAAIQEQRGANKDNIDWSRMGGDLLNPINYFVGGGIGGASKLVNAGRAFLGGASSGAIQPASDPDYWREKQKQVGLGAAFGLVAGAAASAVGKGLDAVGAVLARKNPEFLENNYIKEIIKRIGQDEKVGGPSAQDMIDIVNAGKKPLTLADAALPKGNVRGLAGSVARQPGESKAIAAQLIGKRDEAAAQRIRQDIETYMHGGDSAYQTNEMLLAARSSASTPAYNAAYKLKNIWSPRLQQFIDDPDFKKGLNRGWHLERLRALAEGRKITATELGVDIDMEGNVNLIEVPNMRLLDMAKRGLDAMIADTRDPITGRLSAHGVALNQARHAYVKELEALDTSGAYKRARQAWEGPSASRDAVQLGRAVFQYSPEEMAAEVAKLSPANREFGRIGVADVLQERLAKTGLHGDEAKAILKNSWTREQLRPWFRSPADFDKFVDSITTETKMFEAGSEWVGGSATAGRVAEDTGGNGLKVAFDAARIARDLASGAWGPVRAAVNSWRLYRDLTTKNDPAFNEKIAQILFATRISPETAAKLTGKTPLNTVNPLEKTGAAVSAGGVPAAAAVGVPQAQDRGGSSAPQQNPSSGNQLPQGGLAPHAQLQGPPGAVLSDESPDPVRPGAQYASNEPAKPESALPQEPSNFLADADPAQQAQQAREVAAQRQRQAVQPAEGRQEGAFTDALFDALIPGRAAVRSLTQGEYGKAAVEAGTSAMPYAGKALGAAVQAAPMLTKAVAASTAALTSLFMDTSEGASKLSPEDQSRIRMMQEKSKLEQQNRAKDAEQRKKEADEKADRDAKAAQAAAQTQADLQAKLAQIEADKQREQARIEEEHKAAEQRAAEETIKANAAENKRLAERPFREKHPDADLGMFMGGIAAAAILPGARQAYKQWAFNTYLKDWEKLDAVAAQALKTGTREEQQLAVNRLTAAAAELAKREGKLEKYPWVTQLGAPAIAVEMSMLPAEIDIRQPYGTKAHESAVDYYSDPATYAGLGLVGAGGFGLGHYAHELAEGVIPRGKIPTGTEGTIKTFEERNTAEAIAAETAAKKKAESVAKRKATLEAKKKAEAKEEPRKAKVPRGGSKIYGLRDE